MKSQSIAWHEETLRNFSESVKRKREEFDRLRLELGEMEKRMSLYEIQIEIAKERGKPSFDGDRFLKP